MIVIVKLKQCFVQSNTGSSSQDTLKSIGSNNTITQKDFRCRGEVLWLAVWGLELGPDRGLRVKWLRVRGARSPTRFRV